MQSTTSAPLDACLRRFLTRISEPERLTRRELDVLRLAASGASNEAVAQRLAISVYTVQSHLGTIYGKLGVRGRAEAVDRARALGLLDVTPS